MVVPTPKLALNILTSSVAKSSKSILAALDERPINESSLIAMSPATSSSCDGAVVPIPTLDPVGTIPKYPLEFV